MSVDSSSGAPGTADTPRAIAKDAYLYAFAMLENYQTMHKQAVDATAPEYVGGFGRYRHYSQPFTPDNKDIVTPNNDTTYSWAWLDLRAEPWVLSVPAVPKDRYYVCQWFDLFTHICAYVGVRATGFDAGNYLLAGPRWQGATPAGITKAFNSETDIIGTLTRTGIDGPEDVENVKKIQSQMILRPLSAFLGQPAPAAARAIAFPPYDKARGASADFIWYLNFLLQLAQPTNPAEQSMMARFAAIGIGPGKAFDIATVDAATARGTGGRRHRCESRPQGTPGQDVHILGNVWQPRRAWPRLHHAAQHGCCEGALRQLRRRGLVRRLCRGRDETESRALRSRPAAAGEVLLVRHALHPARP